jgi:hypothetical protein
MKIKQLGFNGILFLLSTFAFVIFMTQFLLTVFDIDFLRIKNSGVAVSINLIFYMTLISNLVVSSIYLILDRKSKNLWILLGGMVLVVLTAAVLLWILFSYAEAMRNF